jgi:aldehyde dehydrogenase (NAD+)
MRPPYTSANIKKLAVRNSAGIKKNWSLEKERESHKRGLVIAKSLRLVKVLAWALVLLGFADFAIDQRLGVLRGVRDFLREVKSFF